MSRITILIIIFSSLACRNLIFRGDEITIIDKETIVRDKYRVLVAEKICKSIMPIGDWANLDRIIEGIVRRNNHFGKIVSVKYSLTDPIYIPSTTGGGDYIETCFLIEIIEVENLNNRQYPLFERNLE